MAVEVLMTEEPSVPVVPQEETTTATAAVEETDSSSDSDPVLERKEEEKIKGEGEAGTGPAAVEKAASFREESNFLSDLKESERKALFDLRARVEEGIKSKGLFVEKGKEKGKEEREGEEEVKCVDEGDKVEEEVRKK